MGLKKGKVYKVELYLAINQGEKYIEAAIHKGLIKTAFCPYDTLSAFYKNWERV